MIALFFRIQPTSPAAALKIDSTQNEAQRGQTSFLIAEK